MPHDPFHSKPGRPTYFGKVVEIDRGGIYIADALGGVPADLHEGRVSWFGLDAGEPFCVASTSTSPGQLHVTGAVFEGGSTFRAEVTGVPPGSMTAVFASAQLTEEAVLPGASTRLCLSGRILACGDRIQSSDAAGNAVFVADYGRVIGPAMSGQAVALQAAYRLPGGVMATNAVKVML